MLFILLPTGAWRVFARHTLRPTIEPAASGHVYCDGCSGLSWGAGPGLAVRSPAMRPRRGLPQRDAFSCAISASFMGNRQNALDTLAVDDGGQGQCNVLEAVELACDGGGDGQHCVLAAEECLCDTCTGDTDGVVEEPLPSITLRLRA